MGKVHRRIGTPIATELSLEADGIQLEQVAPTRLPDVYAGAPVVVFGRYRGRAPASASITVVGSSLGEPLRQRVARTVTPAAPNPEAGAWLSASWARARIRDLEDRYATGDRTVESEIVRVSKTNGVLSRFTAYLAIDRSEIANRGGRLDQHVQAVEEPAGWESKAKLAKPRVSAGVVPLSMPVTAMPRSIAQAAPHSLPGLGRSAPAPAASKSALPFGGPPPMPGSGAIAGGPPSMPGDMRAPRPTAAGGPPLPQGGPTPTYGQPHQLMPHAPPPPPRQKLEMFDDDALDTGSAAPDSAAPDAYLTQLAQLARELATQARGRLDAAAIRVLRQRLTEWLEDVRSVGHASPVAARVEVLVQQLTALLAAPLGAAPVLALALELEHLAEGGTPPATPPPSRGAFWK
jgi:Ca-activated chloride channel family protein